jgi:hypothetical protein
MFCCICFLQLLVIKTFDPDPFPDSMNPAHSSVICRWRGRYVQDRVGDAGQAAACTDKKENQIFLIHEEIQNGSVAKSYMTNSLLNSEVGFDTWK